MRHFGGLVQRKINKAMLKKKRKKKRKKIPGKLLSPKRAKDKVESG